MIYNGIHYDPMAMSVSEEAPESQDTTILSPEDDVPLESGRNFCKEMHDKHQFTDTSKFSIRCMVCGKGLEGEKGAVKHAQETKPPHTNFCEYMK